MYVNKLSTFPLLKVYIVYIPTINIRRVSYYTYIEVIHHINGSFSLYLRKFDTMKIKKLPENF